MDNGIELDTISINNSFVLGTISTFWYFEASLQCRHEIHGDNRWWRGKKTFDMMSNTHSVGTTNNQPKVELLARQHSLPSRWGCVVNGQMTE